MCRGFVGVDQLDDPDRRGDSLLGGGEPGQPLFLGVAEGDVRQPVFGPAQLPPCSRTDVLAGSSIMPGIAMYPQPGASGIFVARAGTGRFPGRASRADPRFRDDRGRRPATPCPRCVGQPGRESCPMLRSAARIRSSVDNATAAFRRWSGSRRPIVPALAARPTVFRFSRLGDPLTTAREHPRRIHRIGHSPAAPPHVVGWILTARSSCTFLLGCALRTARSADLDGQRCDRVSARMVTSGVSAAPLWSSEWRPVGALRRWGWRTWVMCRASGRSPSGSGRPRRASGKLSSDGS